MALPKVGDSIKETRTITDQDVREYARLSGDSNPIHIDDAYAEKTRFKRRIAHGMLVASMLTKLAGMKLPGPGSIYVSQTFKFKGPCYVGDTVTAELAVTNVRSDKPIVTLSTIVRNDKNEVLIDGEAVIFYEPTA
jgi:3-hydroxybutyryl-CoA dehydratase